MLEKLKIYSSYDNINEAVVAICVNKNACFCYSKLKQKVTVTDYLSRKGCEW